jgi:hypothetical protein
MKGAYRVLVRKLERKGPLARPWLRWEDNIKTNLKSVWRKWTEPIWLTVATGSWLL